jgi:hypothetical protein
MRRGLAIGLIAAVPLLAACGGGDSDGPSLTDADRAEIEQVSGELSKAISSRDGRALCGTYPADQIDEAFGSMKRCVKIANTSFKSANLKEFVVDEITPTDRGAVATYTQGPPAPIAFVKVGDRWYADSRASSTQTPTG